MPTYACFKLTPLEEGVLHVELNRPKELNAMNNIFWTECAQVFQTISKDSNVRVVILSSSAKLFTSGLDLNDPPVVLMTPHSDPGRKAFLLRDLVLGMQSAFTSIEECLQPVICCINGGCIGGGVDLVTACDIRYCTIDAYLSVKEVDLGLCADIGTLQRLPKIVSSHSDVKEWCLTGRKISSEEALSSGLVSRVFKNKEEMIQHALTTAKVIASKSPVAVVGTKFILNRTRDMSVKDGLEYVATWNSAMLQTKDIPVSIESAMRKKIPIYPKL